MSTNVDKLHDLIRELEDKPFLFQERPEWLPRGIGKTTLHVHQLAGQIQVGDYDNIMVKVKFYRDLSWLLRYFYEIFKEQGIEVIERPKEQRPVMIVQYEGRQVKLYFFAEHDFHHRSRGFGSKSMEFNLIDY